MDVGKVDIFLESCTIASACTKVLRKRFLKPETVDLIPTGGYSCNQNYRKKALMRILHMEQTYGCTITHARNGREFRLPELPRYSVDGYCAKNKTVHEFLGCFYHGCKCKPLCDQKTLEDDTLAERYKRTMSRIEQITAAGYTVKVIWECEFHAAKIVEQKPELLKHPIVRNSHIHTRDALYGGRTEALHLHYKNAENEDTIQYFYVMSLYPYICKYFKFPIGHPVVHVGDTCKDIRACLQMEGLIKFTIVPRFTCIITWCLSGVTKTSVLPV